MPKSGQSRAAANKEIRREALREQLSNQGHVQHVVDCIGKLQDLNIELEPIEVQRLDKAIGHRLSLIKKYLPDVKTVEHTGDNGESLFSQIIEEIATRDGNGLPNSSD